MPEVVVAPRPVRALQRAAGNEALERFSRRLQRAARLLEGRSVWNVNSTAEGGGVSELLRSCLGYLRDGGIDARWLVVGGDDEFFRITKRIHNRLHGDLGDGGPLGEPERRHYDAVTRRNLDAVWRSVRARDVVIVHDPQPAGLIPALSEAGAVVIWTCHVGVDAPDDVVRSAWDFVRPDVLAASASTFTRAAYVWEGLDAQRVALIPPCIDPQSPKNVDLAPDVVDDILRATALLQTAGRARPAFVRTADLAATISHHVSVADDLRIPPEVPLVAQISRWDALKDPAGVMRSFVADHELSEAHLILAGPAPSSVADDPEAERVLADVTDRHRRLGRADRDRVHVVTLPVEDVVENGVVVNALQRRADVVAQKSLAEGFGLTVTEAMWKGRATVAARVGGIRDQIDDGVSGRLVDPTDDVAFAEAVRELLADGAMRRRLGKAASERVRQRYLPLDYLGAYVELICTLLEAPGP